jgi:hypothetical protein
MALVQVSYHEGQFRTVTNRYGDLTYYKDAYNQLWYWGVNSIGEDINWQLAPEQTVAITHPALVAPNDPGSIFRNGFGISCCPFVVSGGPAYKQPDRIGIRISGYIATCPIGGCVTTPDLLPGRHTVEMCVLDKDGEIISEVTTQLFDLLVDGNEDKGN